MTGYTYILLCSDNSFYTGSTKYLTRRIEQHQNGSGANHTSKRLPVKLVYYEEHEHIGKAFDREKQIQKWSRAKKISLINKNYDQLIIHSKNKKYPLYRIKKDFPGLFDEIE